MIYNKTRVFNLLNLEQLQDNMPSGKFGTQIIIAKLFENLRLIPSIHLKLVNQQGVHFFFLNVAFRDRERELLKNLKINTIQVFQNINKLFLLNLKGFSLKSFIFISRNYFLNAFF